MHNMFSDKDLYETKNMLLMPTLLSLSDEENSACFVIKVDLCEISFHNDPVENKRKQRKEI